MGSGLCIGEHFNLVSGLCSMVIKVYSIMNLSLFTVEAPAFCVYWSCDQEKLKKL